jgi:tetratricopeptide (TPR) repeat protein
MADGAMTDERLAELEWLAAEVRRLRAAADAVPPYHTGADGKTYVGIQDIEYARNRADEAEEVFERALKTDGHELVAEIRRLRGVVAAHDLCHDLHGKVGPREFADGCAAEQRKLYGCAPDADDVVRLKAELTKIDTLLRLASNAALLDKLKERLESGDLVP